MHGVLVKVRFGLLLLAIIFCTAGVLLFLGSEVTKAATPAPAAPVAGAESTLSAASLFEVQPQGAVPEGKLDGKVYRIRTGGFFRCSSSVRSSPYGPYCTGIALQLSMCYGTKANVQAWKGVYNLKTRTVGSLVFARSRQLTCDQRNRIMMELLAVSV